MSGEELFRDEKAFASGVKKSKASEIVKKKRSK